MHRHKRHVRRRGPASDLVRGAGGGGGARGPTARVHVGLDLGASERAVVDPDVVEPALEPLSESRVAADVQRQAGRGDRPLAVFVLTSAPFTYSRTAEPS